MASAAGTETQNSYSDLLTHSLKHTHTLSLHTHKAHIHTSTHKRARTHTNTHTHTELLFLPLICKSPYTGVVKSVVERQHTVMDTNIGTPALLLDNVPILPRK